MRKKSLTWMIVALMSTAMVTVFFLGPKGPTPSSSELDKPATDTLDGTIKDQEVRIYGTAWGMTLAEDGSGFYNDLANLFLQGTDIPVRYDVRPYRRAKALFYRDTNSCLYPSNTDLLRDGGEISSTDGFIDTAGLLQVKVYIFARPGTTPPASIQDIQGRSVAYAMGSRIPFFLSEAEADFIAVANESDKARMLLSGRVDLITAAMPDAKFVFDALGEPLAPFNPDYELNDTQVRITCHDTPRNRAFVAAFNARAAALLSSGKAKAMFEQNRLDPQRYLPAPAP